MADESTSKNSPIAQSLRDLADEIEQDKASDFMLVQLVECPECKEVHAIRTMNVNVAKHGVIDSLVGGMERTKFELFLSWHAREQHLRLQHMFQSVHDQAVSERLNEEGGLN